MKRILSYFTKFEIALWSSSVLSILVSFCIFDKENYLILVASIIGATFLIFNAKGNPAGQFLTIVFSVLYGIISYSFSYYGEMITYLGMTMPMAFFALISWLKNPYQKGKAEVKVNRLSKLELALMYVLTAIVTIVFYLILENFNTANIIPSTLSVTTSFIAVYLTFRRSPYFALAYAMNDLVLIVLWVLASITETSYLSMVICFTVFFVNDMYGFVNWKRIEKKQNNNM